MSFHNFPSHDNMALVQHAGAGVLAGIAQSIGQALYRYGSRVGQEAIDQLSNRLAENAANAGENAITAMHNTIAEWRAQYREQLGNFGWHIEQQMNNAIDNWWGQGGNELVQSYRDPNGQSPQDLIDQAHELIGQNENVLREYGVDINGDLTPEQPTLLDELVPDTSQSTRQYTRARDRARMDSRQQQDDPMQGEQLMAARAGGGGNNPVSKETPISQGVGLSYGLPETHTAIIPWTTFVSYGFLDHDAPLQLQLRMNAIWDMMANSVTTLASAGTIAAKAFHTRPVGPGGVNTALMTFPQTPSTGATEQPQWRNYFAALYDYYTVLSCKYRITINHTTNVRGTDAIVGVQFDTYSDTATTTGNVMPQTKLIEALHYKGINWKVIRAATSENNSDTALTVIEGVYKPGQAKRNIIDDGDVKTWTATGTTLPNLKEILTLNLWKAPLSYGIPDNICGNIQIELQYIVQFKDLKQQARYPNTITTDQDITQILNESSSAAGSALQTQ